MGLLDELADRVKRRLQSEHDEQAAAREAVEAAMRRREERAAGSMAIAIPLQHAVVAPAMETLARQIGATIEHLTLPTGLAAIVLRPRTAQFPARARLSIGVAWSEETGQVWLSADQTFVPVLLPLDRTTQLVVAPAAPDADAVRAWVEARIMAFVDACIEAEVSDVYRRAEHAVDPVCGMMVALGPQVPTIEHGERRYHFCSMTCRDRFARDPVRYVSGAARPSPASDGSP